MKTLFRSLLVSSLFLLLVQQIFSQGVSVNTDGSDADASAMLHVQSTSKGLLIPRMNIIEMFGISNPAVGLLVYCTTDNNFYFYNGGLWNKVVGSADDDWTLDGNDMYSNNTGLIGIGTSNFLPSHKLTIENNASSQVLRLIGNGTYGENAKLSFGDGDYAYIHEFYDDKLLMYANSGLGFLSNFDIEMQSGYGNIKVYVPAGTFSIKDDPSAGESSAILDVNSSSKGFLIPRMTTEQILNIANPADGLQVYNTSTGKLYIFVSSASAWKEVSFGTGAIYINTFVTCGDALIDTRDGQSYPTVEINGQCWMAKNLNIGTFYSGYQNNNSTIEKNCFNNSETYCNTWGGLYQWNEMMQYTTTEGAQGICPNGWHIPTDTEVYQMENFLDPTVNNPAQTGFRGSTIGGKLKETGYTHWTGPNAGATNTSGYTAYASGYRTPTNSFSSLMLSHAVWTSTQSGSLAHYRELTYSSTQSYRVPQDKNYFFAVRCIKD